MDIIDALRKIGRTVAYYPMFSKAVGSNNCGVFLSQMLYWEGKQENAEGWIRKPLTEIYDEIGLTRYELDTVRGKLKALKIMEEKKMGIPCKNHYRFNWGVLNALVEAHLTGAKPPKIPNAPTIVFRMKEVFDKYYLEYFPNLETYEWQGKDWKNIEKLAEVFKRRTLNRFKDMDPDDTDLVHDELIKAWDHFLKMMPTWYRDNHFFPSSMLTNFSAITQQLTTDKKKKDGDNKDTKREGFASIVKTGDQ